MSHKQNDEFAESVNDAREEDSLPRLSLSQAVELAFEPDPYRDVQRESVERIAYETSERAYEYGH